MPNAPKDNEESAEWLNAIQAWQAGDVSMIAERLAVLGDKRPQLQEADDPVVIDTLWRYAIADWRAGDATTLDAALRGGMVIPEFVRGFLADVAAGVERKPRKGPPRPRYKTTYELIFEGLIVEDYKRFLVQFGSERKSGLVARGSKSAKERALDAVAKKWRYKVKPGTVSHIVHKRQGK